MPTYDYKCGVCGGTGQEFMSIRQYCDNPPKPMCCEEPMNRMLSVVPAMSGLANALAGDRHYEGMRAPDGTDIGSRTRHREYMKRTGMTTADDFKGVWKQAEAERTALRQGDFQDKGLRQELTQQVMTAVAQPD